MLKRASFWLALALSTVAIGGLATISPAASHKLTVPKAARALLKDCRAHNGKLRHRYSRHRKFLALHFLEKYSKTRYVRSLSNCERNLARSLHVKLPKHR